VEGERDESEYKRKSVGGVVLEQVRSIENSVVRMRKNMFSWYFVVGDSLGWRQTEIYIFLITIFFGLY